VAPTLPKPPGGFADISANQTVAPAITCNPATHPHPLPAELNPYDNRPARSVGQRLVASGVPPDGIPRNVQPLLRPTNTLTDTQLHPLPTHHNRRTGITPQAATTPFRPTPSPNPDQSPRGPIPKISGGQPPKHCQQNFTRAPRLSPERGERE